MAGQPAPLTTFDHTALEPDNTALFLDFDGTVADLAERPDAVSVPAATREILARLDKSTQGAVAIVTGRPIDEIDRFLDPLKLPVAGVHGLERRAAGGRRTAAAIDEEQLAMVGIRLRSFADAHPGLIFEAKPGSMALHFRQRPELAEAATATVHEAVNGHKGLQILHGKMVVEVKSGTANKSHAVAAFMAEPPFLGRIPVFAGDDVTDEDAFREIARISGVSIKIGGGATAAIYRTPGSKAFRNWLARLADSFETRILTKQGI